jgi:uncharacterized MAPEG superfamily protein
MHLVMFDIDGTLTETMKVDEECFVRSFKDVWFLVAHVTQHHSLLTFWGAHLYFWARLGYSLAAAAGYALLRSLVFWNTALIGIVFFVIALFR